MYSPKKEADIYLPIKCYIQFQRVIDCTKLRLKELLLSKEIGYTGTELTKMCWEFQISRDNKIVVHCLPQY